MSLKSVSTIKNVPLAVEAHYIDILVIEVLMIAIFSIGILVIKSARFVNVL